MQRVLFFEYDVGVVCEMRFQPGQVPVPAHPVDELFRRPVQAGRRRLAAANNLRASATERQCGRRAGRSSQAPAAAAAAAGVAGVAEVAGRP